jgi:hypothetical protein
MLMKGGFLPGLAEKSMCAAKGPGQALPEGRQAPGGGLTLGSQLCHYPEHDY